MPERALPIGTYVVGASLCAISLFYVFGPSFVFDADSSQKRRIVGLDNPANMCFCNSVLQALANSPGLRKYLIRETHRRNLDGPEVYKALPEDVEGSGRQAEIRLYKLDNLQQGIVTHGLKKMLDRLNERPLHKKTISATEFIACLETAFRTRISRQQQDAQEFLQIVLERLCEEYHAGSKARRKFKSRQQSGLLITHENVDDEKVSNACSDATERLEKSSESKSAEESETSPEDSFPFEGQTEAQIECRTCGFKPKPTISTFVTLTLNVPQASQVNLNQCFDGVFKEEVIDDFKCNKCRLEHAKAWKEQELERVESSRKQHQLLSDLEQIKKALSEDPERELPDAHLPELSDAPKRTIKRYMRVSKFPKVLAIHLSRSIYSALSMSTKNLAKVSFPETLSLGGLADPHSYRLSSVVMHKGGHNSGHYETFRRQYTFIPFSTPHSFGTHGVYSREPTPNPSALQIPSSPHTDSKDTSRSPQLVAPSPTTSHVSSLSQPSRSASSRSSHSVRSSLSTTLSRRHSRRAPTSAPREEANGSLAPTEDKRSSTVSQGPDEAEMAKMLKKQKKLAQRWWRVSDERVKEGKTGEVLGMQKEVYLLFYEETES